MTEPQNPMTVEQRQRLVAVEAAGKITRKGGASLATNTGRPGKIQDVIDLAHYIAYGEPYAVAHAHEHGPIGVDLIVGKAGGTLADLLGHVFGQNEDDTKSDGDESSEGQNLRGLFD